MHSQRPILIVGGGVIGLSIGWMLARGGESVTIVECDEAGRGASWVAGGMLAPNAEIGFEETELYDLNRESLRRWPEFVDELETDTGHDLDFRMEGTLTVADDRDAAEALQRLYQFQRDEGLEVEWLTGDEARDIEPFLAPRLAAAVYSPSDYQLDNRALVEALKTGFQTHGGTLHENTLVEAIEPDEKAPTVITEEGESIEGRQIIVAAGAWSRQIEGLDAAHRPPVRPVKGQMLELQMELPFDLEYVVRGPDAYLIPKSDGRLLVGATSEEMGFDRDITAGGLYDLLKGAWEVVPGIYDLPVRDMWVGLRPASRDHAPLLGPSGAPGITVATGHYRHGVLLTPVTAQEITRFVQDGTVSEWIEPFRPDRFVGIA